MKTTKIYEMVNQVNLVIREMKRIWPDFGLEGELQAQGEEMSDRWVLRIGQDGMAYSASIPQLGEKVKCPRCEHEFRLEPKEC